MCVRPAFDEAIKVEVSSHHTSMHLDVIMTLGECLDSLIRPRQYGCLFIFRRSEMRTELPLCTYLLLSYEEVVKAVSFIFASVVVFRRVRKISKKDY